ncbi:hypothetical protein B0H63DRAFT_88429 [Podospora didyma]|uniref:Uncharacterized protein n=1 Tax=Podospora didyma TaxID=330526 RepID=A0AAE0K0X2_9PEZI|nr:hypothetical protein B0H63DRAFT_88429 [Podospora didyma]
MDTVTDANLAAEMAIATVTDSNFMDTPFVGQLPRGLPLEIAEKVIGGLGPIKKLPLITPLQPTEDLDEDPLDQSYLDTRCTLLQLCRTSKLFKRLCTPLVYENPVVRNPEEVQLFSRTLATIGHRGSMVRSFVWLGRGNRPVLAVNTSMGVPTECCNPSRLKQPPPEPPAALVVLAKHTRGPITRTCCGAIAAVIAMASTDALKTLFLTHRVPLAPRAEINVSDAFDPLRDQNMDELATRLIGHKRPALQSPAVSQELRHKHNAGPWPPQLARGRAHLGADTKKRPPNVAGATPYRVQGSPARRDLAQTRH